ITQPGAHRRGPHRRRGGELVLIQRCRLGLGHRPQSSSCSSLEDSSSSSPSDEPCKSSSDDWPASSSFWSDESASGVITTSRPVTALPYGSKSGPDPG